MPLPGSGSFHHAMPIVEVVISPSKAGHECSRNVDASRAALRRPEVREQIELFWSQAPPFPSELSVDEHAELLAKAARVAWRRAAPRVQAAPQAWREEHIKRPAGFSPGHGSRRFLRSGGMRRGQTVSRDARSCWETWKSWPGSICRLRGAGTAWMPRRRRRETLLGKRSSVGWRVRQIPWHACRRRATGRRRGLRCVSWWAARSVLSDRLCQ